MRGKTSVVTMTFSILGNAVFSNQCLIIPQSFSYFLVKIFLIYLEIQPYLKEYFFTNIFMFTCCKIPQYEISMYLLLTSNQELSFYSKIDAQYASLVKLLLVSCSDNQDLTTYFQFLFLSRKCLCVGGGAILNFYRHQLNMIPQIYYHERQRNILTSVQYQISSFVLLI